MNKIKIGKYTFGIRPNKTMGGVYLDDIDGKKYPFQIHKIDDYLGIDLEEFCRKHLGYFIPEVVNLQVKNTQDMIIICELLSNLMELEENPQDLHTIIKKQLQNT